MDYVRRYSKAIAAALSAFAASGVLVAWLGTDNVWVPVLTTLITAVVTVLAPKNTETVRA